MSRTLRSLTACLAVGALGLLAAGCGASHSASATNATSAPRTRPMPLNGRFVGSGKFPGFAGILIPAVIHDPKVWERDLGMTPPQLQTAASQLRRLGFRAATRQTLYGERRSSAEIVSVVEQFRSTRAARKQLDEQGARLPGSTVRPGVAHHPFSVPGIPGAIGFQTHGPSTRSQSVAFSAGPFYYAVGVLAPRGAGRAPSRAQLLGACKSLYLRVRHAFTS
jgi:hypothetical protein